MLYEDLPSLDDELEDAIEMDLEVGDRLNPKSIVLNFKKWIRLQVSHLTSLSIVGRLKESIDANELINISLLRVNPLQSCHVPILWKKTLRSLESRRFGDGVMASLKTKLQKLKSKYNDIEEIFERIEKKKEEEKKEEEDKPSDNRGPECFDIIEDLITAHIEQRYPHLNQAPKKFVGNSQNFCLGNKEQSVVGVVAGEREIEELPMEPNGKIMDIYCQNIFKAFSKEVVPYGTVHCEAAMASFSLSHYTDYLAATSSKFEHDSDSQAIVEIFQDPDLSTISVSKLCCPVCWELIRILRGGDPTKLWVHGYHTTLFPLELPAWLPYEVLEKLVEKFKEYLTVAIKRLVLTPGLDGVLKWS